MADTYDYAGEYANFDTQDFGSLGNTDQYGSNTYYDSGSPWTTTSQQATDTTPYQVTGNNNMGYGSEYMNGLFNMLMPGSTNTQQGFNTAGYGDFNAALNDTSGVSAQALTPVTPQVTTQYKPEGEGFLSKLFAPVQNKATSPYEKDPIGSILKTAAGIYGMNQANQNRRALQQVLNPMQQYQQRLSETYTNPQAYLNSPEAKAMQSQLAQQMLRRDAASGRRSQYGARANELNQQMLSQLGNYRKGLAGLYNPQVQGQLTSAIQGQSPGGALLQGLGSLYAPQMTQEQQQAQALLTLLGRK